MGPQLFYIDINDKLGDDVSDDDVDIDDECNCAPLQHVSVTGLVRDTVAQFTLVQSFVNPLKNATIEAAYHFPLYEGVAVCGFEAEVDGRKIHGRVQERSAARKEFEGAVKAGKMASLMEQETPDVFQTSLGNVPPGKEVIVRITLVSEVKNDADENSIRFVLPTAIAPRYGEFPGPAQAFVVGHSKMFPDVPLDVAGSSLSAKLSVDLSFAMSQPISSVQSPSHTIQVHLGADKTGEEAQSDPNFARTTLTADTFMDRDFVVVVKSPGVEEPKVLVERHPEHGTHAMALTFSPRFALNPIGSSELVFLVDRSGSMEGETIEQAGQALQLFLNSIPSENLHYINIIGFGDTHQALFPRSVDYDASSLKQAMEYARSLTADMGGTEIASAFQEVLDRRRKDIPTQIFALTDGEVWDVDSIVDTIRAAVEEGEKSGAFVRVFSLGVGDAVSHHTIEAIARAGDGYGQVVVEGERMEKKVVQLLKASLTPPITDLYVQWTDDNHSNDVRFNEHDDAEFEFIEPDSWCGSDSDEDESTTSTKAPINLFGTLAPEEEPGTKAPGLPEIVTEILQTPFRIPPPYRGARLTIAAILSSSIPVPEHIVLRGTSRDGPVELRVKVGPVMEHGETLLHTLTARSLMRDMKEGSSYLSAIMRKPQHDSKDGQTLKRLGIRLVKVADSSIQSIHPVSTAELLKRETIDIGLKHCLSSKYTSWIAIDECNRQLINFKPTGVQPAAKSYELCDFPAGYSPAFNCPESNNEEDPDAHFRYMSAVTSKFALEDKVDDFEYFGCANPYENEALQEGWRTTCDVTAGSGGGIPMLSGARVFFPASARGEDELDAYSTSAHATVASSGGGESPKSSIHFKLFGHHHDATFNKSSTPAEELLSLDPHLRLLAILQHQSFDGSFQLASELGDLFHASVAEMEIALAGLRTKLVDHEAHDISKIPDDHWRLVWATCLAVLYMQRDLAQLQEEWELVVAKADKKVEVLLQQNKDVVAMAKHEALQFAELHTRS